MEEVRRVKSAWDGCPEADESAMDIVLFLTTKLPGISNMEMPIRASSKCLIRRQRLG
jgi:hypothetical protein